MKTTKTIVILLALVLLTAAGAQSDEKPAKKEISNTRIASCLVKITTDEAVLPLDEFAVESLLRSSGVAGKAAREVLETSPDVASELFEIEEVYSNVFPDSGGIGGGGYGGGMMGGGYGGGMGGGTAVTRTTTSRTPTRISTTPTTSSPRLTTTPPPRTPARPTTPSRRPTPRRTPTVTNPQPSTTDQTILFHLRVDFSQVSTEKPLKPAAEEFMVALIENLRSALRGVFDQYRAKLDKQLNLAGEEAQRAEMDLVRMQARLREISGSRDLSRSVILRDISNLRRQLQDIIMHQASQEIYIQATIKRIAETQSNS